MLLTQHRIAFDVNYGLFEEKEDKTLVPSPDSSQVEDHLKYNLFKRRQKTYLIKAVQFLRSYDWQGDL